MLRFTLPPGSRANLSVYDVGGRLVRRLARAVPGGGDHVVTWDGRARDGRAVAPGVYFGRLVVDRGAKRDVLMRKIVIGR
jgi:flagellar hook assembly protein FlgD